MCSLCGAGEPTIDFVMIFRNEFIDPLGEILRDNFFLIPNPAPVTWATWKIRVWISCHLPPISYINNESPITLYFRSVIQLSRLITFYFSELFVRLYGFSTNTALFFFFFYWLQCFSPYKAFLKSSLFVLYSIFFLLIPFISLLVPLTCLYSKRLIRQADRKRQKKMSVKKKCKSEDV